jgi:hypothetical protein
MPYYLLEPTTAAVPSREFVANHKALPVQFSAFGLQGDETATVKKKSADGNFYPYTVKGEDPVLTATNQVFVPRAPGIYILDKSLTDDPVGIEVSTDMKP